MQSNIFKQNALVLNKRISTILIEHGPKFEKAGLDDFRLKDFRHTFASWHAINGTPLIVIRDLMGHKNIKTTEVYAHLCPSLKDSAMADVFK